VRVIHRVTRIERVAYGQGSSVDPTQIENTITEDGDIVGVLKLFPCELICWIKCCESRKDTSVVTRIERVAYGQGSSVDPTQIENTIGEVDAARQRTRTKSLKMVISLEFSNCSPVNSSAGSNVVSPAKTLADFVRVIHRVTRIERVAYGQGSSVDPTQIENTIGEVDAARLVISLEFSNCSPVNSSAGSNVVSPAKTLA
jgi:hypothetical protein